MSVNWEATFEEILEAAGVTLSSRGLYLEKRFRNCESQAAVFSAFRLALSQRDKEIKRLMKSNSTLATEKATEASEHRKTLKKASVATHQVIGARLEAIPDLTPATRERILTVE